MLDNSDMEVFASATLKAAIFQRFQLLRKQPFFCKSCFPLKKDESINQMCPFTMMAYYRYDFHFCGLDHYVHK